jgi:integrase/recombinase XerD
VNVSLWQERFVLHLTLMGCTAATIRGYRYVAGAFLRFLSDGGLSEVHEIRREDVQAYQVYLHRKRKSDGNPLALVSQNREMVAVLAFCRFLLRERHVLVDPGHDVSLMRVPRQLPARLLDEAEVLRLLSAPDTSGPFGLRDRAILELLYSSALRNAELRALEVGDVDIPRLQVRVNCGKGRKSRMVPLGEPAAAWAEEYLRDGRGSLLRGSDPGQLFLSSRGVAMSCEALGEIVRKHALAAGLASRVTPHLLRHCCATHMLARQAGLRHLQEMLGHASPESTQIYTRVEISDLREVHQRCHPRESF